MLKHVQISPVRVRSDTVSLRSSTSCASSLCGSPEPIERTSRASSYCSLEGFLPQTTIKVFTSCLKLDIEYKTLGLQWDTTSKDVVNQILRRCKLRQRDSRLFYLTMEVAVRKAGIKTILMLDDDARPAILQACHPKGDSRFCLQMKPGGLIRIHTSVLQPTSLYKSLFISEETTSDELLRLLLSCYDSNEPVEKYSLYEVCCSQEYQRKLHPDDFPLCTQQQRTQNGEQFHLIVRKNPLFPRRKQLLLPSIVENKSTLAQNIDDIDSNNCSKKYECQLNYTKLIRVPTTVNLNECISNGEKLPNSFIETTYNPVYNIREIRSFSIDKKILDVKNINKSPSKLVSFPAVNIRHSVAGVTNQSVNIIREAVNNNPAKGYGSYVYI